MTWQYNILLVGASALAGAVNSVAGGGTLLTFPALLWAGQSALIANATSTVALWPGALSSLWGYRREVGRDRPTLLTLGFASLLGGLAGATLLVKTSSATFARIVPFLLLAATLLFIAQEPLSRWLRRRTVSVKPIEPPSGESAVSEKPRTALPAASLLGAAVFQFFIAIYGGYFGAGAGIMMLTAFGLMGFTDIHQMNGLKNINALILNAIAAVLFISRGLVDWRVALTMAIGSIIGGSVGSGTARRIGQKNVRLLIIAIGLALTVWMLVKPK